MRRNVRTRLGGCIAALGTLGAVGTALAHDFDHPAPSFSQPAPLSSSLNAGGENAEWELVATIPTGNPQTDLDFFTNDGVTYASVGSLGIGPNSAGQNIIQLTNEQGEVDPAYVTGHPSGTCLSDPSAATGLQHDAEASPKGTSLPQFPNPYIVKSDTQVVIDATDAYGRCHDQGTLGQIVDAPQGGLEIIDVTDPAAPKEIGLTSHVGEAHTVNVDPKRPHIAFVSSSDAVNLIEEGEENAGERPNEQDGSTSLSFDGIEVVDFSSCLNFPEGATLDQKRTACEPDVYRYRWPNANISRSHTYRGTGACHELEIYPDDRLVCAGLMATPVFDISDAFDDNGTPTDFSDDKPKGEPLPCQVRESSTTAAPFTTGASVVDCVDGQADADPETESLRVADWIALGSPSWEGVKHLGTYHHMGFEDQAGNNFEPAYPATEDIFVAHEAEFTQSGRYVLVTDERGGGILPGGATCGPGVPNDIGNGGIHAFRVDRLSDTFPEGEDAVAAYQENVYATDSEGNRAIYRAPINTKPQGAVCTSHVFEQIPGQNRIFMAWYSQGTQVVDFTENPDGTIDFETAGYFIPENANEWVSHIFKVEQNPDGSFTYWGAAADFAIGDAGRNAIEVYKVTMPAPPKPAGDPLPGTPTFPRNFACASASGFASLDARPRAKRKRVRFSFAPRRAAGVTAKVFRQSTGRRIARKRVKTFRNRTRAFTWKPRRARNGFYDVRFRRRAPNGKKDIRHLALRRKRGRFFTLPAFDRRASCSFVQYYSLGRSVFGGRDRKPLRVRFQLNESANVRIQVKRRGKVVKRVKRKIYARGKSTVKIRLGRRAKRGAYRVTLKANAPGHVSELTLRARYL
jgi:hypothetical protein